MTDQRREYPNSLQAIYLMLRRLHGSKWFEHFIQFWLCSVVIFVLLGNAASDIWLVGTTILFLIHCAFVREWDWMQTRWLQLFLLFWAWIIIASLLAPFPMNSASHTLAWIRFPLFAIALLWMLEFSKPNLRLFLMAMTTTIAVTAVILIAEKLANPQAVRLFGTWGQSPKVGWLLLGFGLPVSYWGLIAFRASSRLLLMVVTAIGLLVAITVMTGEVYVSIALIFGLGLFLLIGRPNINLSIALALLSLGAIFLVMWLSPELAGRFTHSLETRLPWLESSDYYAPWMRGLEMARQYPVFGVGPVNEELVCETVDAIRNFVSGHCQPHAHNIYIQIAADTGYFGVVLFIIAVVALFQEVTRGWTWRKPSLYMLAALCLLIVTFWPISTFSNVFGQHRNFFLWLTIAMALAFARKARQTMEPSLKDAKAEPSD